MKRKTNRENGTQASGNPLILRTDNAIALGRLVDHKTLEESNNTGVVILDKNLNIMWANKVVDAMYPASGGARNKRCFKFFRHSKTQCIKCPVSRAFERKIITTDIVKRKLPLFKELKYVQIVAVPLIDEKGQVSQVMEIILDVTQSKEINIVLQKSEEFYRTLFEHSGTAIAINNREGIITSVNKTFCDLSGYSKEEIEGKKHYLEFVVDKDRVAKIHEKRWARKGSSPTKYEFVFLTRNKGKRLIDITINRIPGTKLSIASMIDNTEMKNLEKTVREKDQFLANILQESADGIIVLGHDRIIKTWNKGAEQIFGYKPDEIVGENYAILVPEDLLAQNELDRLRANVLEFGFIRNHITERIRKDKRRVTVAETATLIKDEHGNPIGRAIIFRDITERILLEQQVMQNEKMLAIGTLSASLAHEIKNPLNSIVINMEILKGQIYKSFDDRDIRPFEKYVNTIQSEISRLDRVIRDFLNFAKPQSTQFKTININEIIRNVVELMDPEAHKSNIVIHTMLDKELYKVHGEDNQLKQIFINLILNGIQAMPNGGNIKINTRNKPDGKVLVTISDTGEGIRNEDKSKIYDLFYTTKQRGSGLGLSMVSQLIKNHSGQISFESQEGKGTAFHLTFPAK